MRPLFYRSWKRSATIARNIHFLKSKQTVQEWDSFFMSYKKMVSRRSLLLTFIKVSTRCNSEHSFLSWRKKGSFCLNRTLTFWKVCKRHRSGAGFQEKKIKNQKSIESVSKNRTAENGTLRSWKQMCKPPRRESTFGKNKELSLYIKENRGERV